MRPLLGVAAAVAAVLPFYLLARRVWPTAAPRLARLFHRTVIWAFRITVVREGTPTRPRGVLFVCNHLSWCDIPVLGATVNGRFVSKAEVAGWAGIGWLASRGETLFIDRERRHHAGVQGKAIAAALRAGENVILFPEGTTSDGRRVKRFRSALFAAANAAPNALIQPVSLAYAALDGLPITRGTLPHVVWMGDIGVGAHAHRLATGGRVRAVLRFHSAVSVRDFADRKALAVYCEQMVADGYAELMRGRPLSARKLPI